MSLRESPMIRWYWNKVGGTLVEEYLAVPARRTQNGPRLIDAIIIKDGEKIISRRKDVDFKNKDILVIQAKASRLGMSLMGQALFSLELMKKFKPRSIESIALCSKDDVVLRPLFEKHSFMKVVICEHKFTEGHTWDHNMPDNQDGFINTLIKNKKCLPEIIKEFEKRYPNHKHPRNRVLRHINHLLKTHVDFPYVLKAGYFEKKI